MRMRWALLVVTIITAEGLWAYTPPDIPKEKIPSDIPAEVREQIEKLYSSAPAARLVAAEKLGRMSERAVPAIPFLVELLGDDTLLLGGWKGASPGTAAAESLGKIGGPSVKPLIAALKDENPVRRRNTTRALVEIDVDAVEELIAALKDKNPNVRGQAAMALGEIKDRRTVEPLISIAKDPEPFVRANVVRALGEIGDYQASIVLISALQDENAQVRRNTARAFFTIRTPQAVEGLVPHWEIKMERSDKLLRGPWEA